MRGRDGRCVVVPEPFDPDTGPPQTTAGLLLPYMNAIHVMATRREMVIAQLKQQLEEAETCIALLAMLGKRTKAK